MNRAIFLDRDGVINVERADYVKSWEEFAFLPGALEAIRRLSALPWLLVVISNQSCVGRGIVPPEVVNGIHERMREVISEAGGRIDAVFVCPHHPEDGCACRKPRAGLLLDAARSFDIDLNRSIFIGDSVTDAQAARVAGCMPLLVRSGRQGARLDDLLKDDGEIEICADLPAAVKILLASL